MYLPLYIIHGPLLTLYWRAERPGRGGRGGLLRRSLSPQSNLVRPFSHFPTLWKNLSWEREMKLRQKAAKSENGRGRFSTFGTLVGVRLCLRRATRAHPARREIERHAHEIQSCEWVVGSGGLINSKASIIMRFVWAAIRSLAQRNDLYVVEREWTLFISWSNISLRCTRYRDSEFETIGHVWKADTGTIFFELRGQDDFLRYEN